MEFVLMNGTYTLIYKGDFRELLCPFYHVKTQREDGYLSQVVRPHQSLNVLEH
jgi:hypothetical protein